MAAMVLAPPVRTGKDKLDPRLTALCMSNDVDPGILDLMGDNGLTTCALLKHVVEDDAELRQMLKAPPFDLSARDFPTKRKIGAVCAVYEQCQVSIDIQVKADAERLHHNLPPEITEENYEQAIKLFEHQFYPLEKVKTPSKAFFERIVHQIVTRFSVIGYKSVTNRTQDDINMPKTNLTLDPVTGSFRNTTQEYFIAMPSDSEAYRARMKTLGVGYVLGRLKHPMKIQLRTATVETMQYQDWLFGENC